MHVLSHFIFIFIIAAVSTDLQREKRHLPN